MAPHPRVPHDFALAPVAVSIDINLQLIRDVPVGDLERTMELALDQPERTGSSAERIERIVRAATRNVDLHGWEAHITDDHARIRLTGGSVTLDLGLSAALLRFVEDGRDR